MTLPSARALVTLGLVSIIASCARVQRVALDPVPIFDTRDLVEVWGPDSTARLHAVRIDGDTLSGVSYLMPTSCDSCRISVPLAGVDSLRAGSTGEKTTLLILGGVAAWLAIFAIIFQSGSGT